MPVTQTWYMVLVPDALHAAIAEEYALAAKDARIYLAASADALKKWRQLPESFNWYAVACDIRDRHMYYAAWCDTADLNAFFGLFRREAFEALFFRHMKFCGPGEKCGELEVATVVVTQGDTAPAILFQAIGEEAIDGIPGFFGNFFIAKGMVGRELERYHNLLARQDWSSMIRRGAALYNAPCGNGCDSQVVQEVLQALSIGLKSAQAKRCGLLGLAVSAG